MEVHKVKVLVPENQGFLDLVLLKGPQSQNQLKTAIFIVLQFFVPLEKLAPDLRFVLKESWKHSKDLLEFDSSVL